MVEILVLNEPVTVLPNSAKGRRLRPATWMLGEVQDSMASFWARVGRWLDSVLGGAGGRGDDVDPAKVDAAIRLIQATIEEEQRERQMRRLRVADLPPERQAQLANELANLLRKPPTE